MFDLEQVEDILGKYKEEMKAILLKSVKDEIETLKKHNEELRIINEKLRLENSSVKQRQIDIDWKERNLEANFIKDKFSDLLEPLLDMVHGYKATRRIIKIPKCNKCNKDRKEVFKSTSGEERLFSCSCDKNKHILVPEYKFIKYIKVHKQCPDEFVAIPVYNVDYDNRRLEVKFNKCVTTFDESKIQELKQLDVLFLTDAECQKYCDVLNKEADDKQCEYFEGGACHAQWPITEDNPTGFYGEGCKLQTKAFCSLFLELDTKQHKCDSCGHDGYSPGCPGYELDLQLGDGLGNDNIIRCAAWTPHKDTTQVAVENSKIIHVVLFNRTQGGPAEQGISIGEGGAVIDFDGNVATDIWDIKGMFHEGCFVLNKLKEVPI